MAGKRWTVCQKKKWRNKVLFKAVKRTMNYHLTYIVSLSSEKQRTFHERENCWKRLLLEYKIWQRLHYQYWNSIMFFKILIPHSKNIHLCHHIYIVTLTLYGLLHLIYGVGSPNLKKGTFCLIPLLKSSNLCFHEHASVLMIYRLHCLKFSFVTISLVERGALKAVDTKV